MIKHCENCGGQVRFSPEDKGNKCQNCGSVFPVDYIYEFNKKSFEESKKIKADPLAKEMKSVKCNSCGASIVMDKNQLQNYCPYCGNSELVENAQVHLMYIDNILPFSFDRANALTRFNNAVKSSFLANKKIFKSITENDINGSYINAFVFDVNTSTTYKGVLSYTVTTRDKDGNTKRETRYRHVSGVIENVFNNLTVEANSNLEQQELQQILPYNYGQAVKFNADFMNGYMLEYQDKMFEDCFKVAENQMNQTIKRSILQKYHCDNIVRMDMNVEYPHKTYNYSLLPVYFVSTTYKDKKYKALMNGQTGKVGKLPKSIGKILLLVFTILGIVGLVALIVWLCS